MLKFSLKNLNIVNSNTEDVHFLDVATGQPMATNREELIAGMDTCGYPYGGIRWHISHRQKYRGSYDWKVRITAGISPPYRRMQNISYD